MDRGNFLDDALEAIKLIVAAIPLCVAIVMLLIVSAICWCFDKIIVRFFHWLRAYD